MVNVDFVNKNHHSKPSSQNRVRKSLRDRDAERRQPERNHPKPMTRSCRKCGNQHGYGKCPAFGSIEDARGREVDNLEMESWVLELEINERPVELKTQHRGNGKRHTYTLSRAFENKEFDENIDIEIEAQVCLISMNLNITDEKRKEYIRQTDLDNELIALKNMIKEGWPSKIKDVPENLKFYHRIKHEITEINGLYQKTVEKRY
ncbi:hypothetical protein JTB14_004416 [Gonioctena quinquepunctata]|nr:hypothetical protein JTB14_004416 [Gonioctena quinquepunctata]